MSLSFDDLVTAATVGVSRKPLPITDLDGPAAVHVGALDAGDPAGSLLAAAALLTVARRAGFRPEQAITSGDTARSRTASSDPATSDPATSDPATSDPATSDPATSDTAGPGAASEESTPELSPRAEQALRLIGRAHLAPGFAAGDSELLADLLTAASDAGYVSSAPLLPDLLDAAVRSAALRPAVVAVLGVRGRWLAGHRPDWQRITDAVPRVDQSAAGTTATPPAVTVSSDDPEVWRTGSRGERHANLAARRQRDPKGGRELLAADWAQQTGDERAALLAVLVRGLSADDEEFLDAALDDRAAAVRGVARRLLTMLPGSRFGQRATERALAVLRLERHGTRGTLVASVPGDPDAAAVRDGIDARRPSPSIGPGAWLLIQIIAAVPLASWTRLFGLEPSDIVELPVESGRRMDVHAGWRLAAVDQRNSQWAEALLGVGDPDDGSRPPAAWPADQRLAATLPPDRLTARAAALLASTNLNAGPAVIQQVIAEVGGGPVPWPAPLADAVVIVLGRAAPLAVLPRLPRGLLDMAARGLPAVGDRDYAAELTRLADAHPQTWSPLLRKTVETILLRRAFLEEIR
ncbi:MAG: DUF5691 domain-containing protein [Trebonia sp.]|jgi:hypothetical protein